MARILLSAIVTEIRGKIGGTVFQSGLSGFQAKQLALPRDIRIPAQIANRQKWVGTIGAWGTITTGQRNTWVANPDTGLGAYNTFVRRNSNMRFFGQSPFVSFPGNSSAPGLDLTATVIDSTQFLLTGVAPFNNLPSGSMVSINATRLVSPGKQGFSPSEFVSVAQLTGPIDFAASPQDIFTQYTAKFGALITGRKLQFTVKTIILATGNVSSGSQGSFIVG
jgi:hypothetical protein